jgi:nicotinic acid mononucleotide adenylyltransferase
MGALEAALDRMRAVGAPAIELITERPAAPPRSVGLLSGSFDPITVAHVRLAEAALATSDLVVFVYSVRTLPKEGRGAEQASLLTELERLEALSHVCAGDARFAAAVCSRGLLVEQVEAAAAAFPGAELSVVVGSDKLLQLFDPRWYEDSDAATSALLSRALVRFGIRSGDERAVRRLLRRDDLGPRLDRLRPLDVPPEVAAVSSSHVRDLIRRELDVSELIPEEARPIVRADPA